MIRALAIACASPDSPPLDEVPDTGTWTAPERVVPSPTWTADTVAQELDEVASQGLPNLSSVRDVYVELMALGDETCPGDPTRFDDTTVPLTGCTSENGVSYAGVAAIFEDEDLGGTATDGFIVFGDFQLTDPDGATLVGGGKAMQAAGPSQGGVAMKTELSGSWSYPASAGWLGDGASGAMYTDGTLASDTLALEISGGLGLRDRATYTSGLHFDDATCPQGHPSGDMSIRDPSGGWWTVTLPDDCSGCGELTWTDGTSHGEVCPELWRLGASWRSTASGYLP